MSVAFWSQIVKPGESEDVQPPEGYVLNVQNIALTGSKSEKDSAQVFAKTLSVDGEMSTTLLGTLRPMACDQFQTQLVFGFDVPVTFVVESSNSKVSVHMSGYYQPGPDDEEEEDSEEEYDSDENMEVYQNLVSSGGMDGFPVGDEDSEDVSSRGCDSILVVSCAVDSSVILLSYT